MGVANSPLRDRVIFVEGVQRSGTTWLVTLLCLHPLIAGQSLESHLFDIGVDRLFENYERPTDRFLRGYVSRAELVDLVRDLCDGVLIRMRDSTHPDAEFVVEKTPAPFDTYLRTSRKLECFPDGWFVHIVRDGHDVARSLVRMPWMGGRSEAQCYELWQLRCEELRSALSPSPRYRELAYEELRADPAGHVADLLKWVGLEGSQEYLQEVREASRVPHDAWAHTKGGRAPHRSFVNRLRQRVVTSAKRTRKGGEVQGEGEPTVTTLGRLAEALRDSDLERLRACTTESFALVFHGPSESVSASGDEAVRALHDLGRRIYRPRLINERWRAAAGAWLGVDSSPAVTALVTGSRGDGSRVDFFMALAFEGHLVSNATLIAPRQLDERTAVGTE